MPNIRRRVATVPLCAFTVLAAMPAAAGPCYVCTAGGAVSFRDDRVLPSLPAGGDASEPDVAVEGDRAWVAFVDDAPTPTNPGGLEQIWIAWSEAFGCSWTAPVQLSEDVASPSGSPAVAVAGGCLDVVYARNGRIFHRRASLATFPAMSFDPEEALSSPAVSPFAANPDVTAVDSPAGVHFYAVWEAQSGGGSEHLMLKKSLACATSGSWTGATAAPDESDLTDLVGPPDFAASDSMIPVVAADTFAGPGSSAVTIAFLNNNASDNPAPDGWQGVYLLRSVDSGQTFFGDVPAAAPLPRKVDDPASGASHPAGTAVALASSDDGGAGSGNWSFLVWSDQRTTTNRDTYIDARLEDATSSSVPLATPDTAAENGSASSREPAATAWRLPGATSAEARSYHIQSRRGFPEINLRAWTLSPGAPSITTSCSVGGQSILQLTGLYPAVRTAGAARDPSAADALYAALAPVPVEFVAWVDDRSGSDEIWWKTTDPIAPGPPTGLALAPTACPVSGFDLTWTPPADCDVASYIVSWDDGSTLRSVSLPAAPAAHLLTGLVPNLDYTVKVQAMDEACNLGAEAAMLGRTPSCLSPVLAEAALPVPDDQCNTTPAPGHRDGEIEPNEIVKTVLLPITNIGSAPATGVTGWLEPHPDVVLGTAISAWPDIPAGSGTVSNTTPFSFLVRSTVPCGSDIDLTLDVIAAEIPSGFPLVYRFSIPGSGAGCDVCGVNAFAIPQTPTYLDDCSGTGSGAGNGLPDPGETLTALKLSLRNAGTTAITNVNVVSLTSANPGVTVLQGLSAYNDILPGTTELNLTDFALQLDSAAFACTGTNPPLQLDLTILYDQLLVAQTLRFNIPTPDPGNCGSCVGGTCPMAPAPVPDVKAVKQGLADVKLLWPTVAGAATFNVFKVIDGSRLLIPQATTTTAGSNPNVVGVCLGVPEPGNTCTDAAAVPAAPSLLYYQVRGVCFDGLEGDSHPY